MRGIAIAIVARWGACLLPFSFAPIPVTLVCFAAGGLIYGPFVPLTYALFQSATPASDLPAVLAARGTVVIVSTPLGIALGGPLVSLLGGAGTLAASGLATVLLAAVSFLLWRSREPASGRGVMGDATEQLSRSRPGGRHPTMRVVTINTRSGGNLQ